MNWSKNAWQAIAPIYERIVTMPFIKELVNGTLDKEKFKFYIMQDSIYLEHFSKALALIAARCTKIEDSFTYHQFAQNAIVVENHLHDHYFKDFGIEDVGVAQPACHQYFHFLKSTTSLDSVEVGMAAVLPCFWIYKAVGDYILKNQVGQNNPYQKWIDTYGGEEFSKAVQQAINICDIVAEGASSQTKEDMLEAFITASHLEYDFWDAAYKLRKW